MSTHNSNNKKEEPHLSSKNTIVKNINVFYPTPQKIKQLVKPDFSPITNLENKFGLKTNGSYKKRANLEPESPVKTPSTNYLTPIKIEGKDLFGIKKDNQHCRKLNFDNIENDSKPYNYNKDVLDSEMNNFLNKFNMNEDNNFNTKINPTIETNKNNNKLKECNNRMETQYSIIKRIYEKKLDAAYKVKEKKTGKKYFIKKNSKKSKKNNFSTIQTIFTDMKKSNSDEIGEQFCMKYLDYWIENEDYELMREDINYRNKNLYILLEYYPLGDVLDYKENLDKNNFVLKADFYWDMIFEMIFGLYYFHSKGYIHFDIKPTNFIVDNNGYIKLNDFGLSHKIEELSHMDDIIEGDSRYISKELFEAIDKVSISSIDNRCDVFSLGLTFLEIMANIELPPKGKLWKDIRSDNYVIPEDILNNIEDNKQFLELIKQMISPISKRPTLIELINGFPQLKKRYDLLKNKKYKKSCPLMVNFEKENEISKNCCFTNISHFDSFSSMNSFINIKDDMNNVN